MMMERIDEYLSIYDLCRGWSKHAINTLLSAVRFVSVPFIDPITGELRESTPLFDWPQVRRVERSHTFVEDSDYHATDLEVSESAHQQEFAKALVCLDLDLPYLEGPTTIEIQVGDVAREHSLLGISRCADALIEAGWAEEQIQEVVHRLINSREARAACHWIRHYAASCRKVSQISYWRDVLNRGAFPVLPRGGTRSTAFISALAHAELRLNLRRTACVCQLDSAHLSRQSRNVLLPAK